CLDAVKGAGIGLGVGLTAALVSITIPGFGVIAGGGALATAIAGTASATAAGAVAGAVLSHFKDAGIPEKTAEDLLRAYENGWAIVVLEIPDGALGRDTAVQILENYCAALRGSSRGAWRIAVTHCICSTDAVRCSGDAGNTCKCKWTTHQFRY